MQNVRSEAKCQVQCKVSGQVQGIRSGARCYVRCKMLHQVQGIKSGQVRCKVYIDHLRHDYT